jgi:hypothetical protein
LSPLQPTIDVTATDRAMRIEILEIAEPIV